ncbi:MAG: hypothetical protein NC489_19725 [Ruminococcus flavefaciens]|nr:hypothetical protein [Ruminococcus flavefaciens]
MNVNHGKPKLSKRRREVEAALLSLDEQRIRACMKKYSIREPSNDLVFWAGVHKAITAIYDAPEEKKVYSRVWLYSHGFRQVFG